MRRLLRYAVLLALSLPVQAQCPSPSDALNNLIAVQNSSDGLPEKIKQLIQLKDLYLKCSSKDSVYARIVHRLGDFYSKTGDMMRAIDYTKEAIAANIHAGKAAENSYLANSYFNLAGFCKRLYLLDDAHKYFDSCMEIGKQYPDKYRIAFMACEANAYSFFQTGDYQKSVETADKGILFFGKINDTLSQAPLLSQKAQSQDELNEIPAAEENIKKAIAILEHSSSDTDQIATSYSIYAHLLNKKGDPASAIQFYQKSFQLHKAEGHWLQCSRDMLDLGYVYDKDLKNLAKAIACYRQGIQMLEKANDPYQLSALYINMGLAYWRNHNYVQSLAIYQKALNSLPIHFSDTSIVTNPSTDMLKLVANDYFVSTLLANKAEAFLDRYKKEKEHEWLLASINTYIAADQSIDMMRWKQYGEKSKLFWREQTKKMYEKAIEACYLLSDVDKAYYFFEKSRAVLLNDKLSELGAKRFIAQDDRISEEELHNKMLSLDNQLLSIDPSAPNYNSTKQQVLAAQDDWERFTKTLEQKYPAYYQYKYNNLVYPLAGVKEKLRANQQSLIEYFNGDSVVFALRISPSGDAFIKIPFKNYGTVAKEFIAICSDKIRLNQDYHRYRSLAANLYENLFASLHVPEGRVVISPDDYFIPFDALTTDSSSASSFLLKKYAFSYTYSMGLQMKYNNERGAGKSFLGVAPVNYKPFMQQQSLEGSDESLHHIKTYFKNASFLIKDDATKKEFLESLPEYSTVQIYSHADADSSGKQPVLYLADSTLNINEIQGLEDFRTDMIVLSACNTGVGKNAKGEGIFSLARAFTTAGIPSTVTTLWQVDNQATYQLTEAFYKYLSQGLPKDIALQKAKLEFLESNDKTYQLPYYWAASIMLGKTEPAKLSVASESKANIGILIASMISAIVALFFVLRRRSVKMNR